MSIFYHLWKYPSITNRFHFYGFVGANIGAEHARVAQDFLDLHRKRALLFKYVVK
jgi:hypothetical protein